MSDCQCGATTVIARYRTYHHMSLAGMGDPLPFVWTKMAERYSCLGFTHPMKDRLIALAGVAKDALKTNRAGEYLAGHWTQDLASQLCWTVMDTWLRPAHYLASSWSWLSVFGRMEFIRHEYKRDKPSQIDIKIISASCQPSGTVGLDSVKSGEIVLKGRILDVEAEVVQAPQNKPAQYRLSHRGSGLEYKNFKPDCIMRPKEATNIEQVSILFWGNTWIDSAISEYRSTFMVLRVAQDRPGSFQRLGLFSFSTEKESQETQRWVDTCEVNTNICIV